MLDQFCTAALVFQQPIIKVNIVKFQPYWKNWCFCYIFHVVFFTNSEKATKSKFRQEMLNILSALKCAGSYLAFHEWKVSFSLISPIIFSLGRENIFLAIIFNFHLSSHNSLHLLNNCFSDLEFVTGIQLNGNDWGKWPLGFKHGTLVVRYWLLGLQIDPQPCLL